MFTRDEEQAIAAVAAVLLKVPAARRSAIASAALHRLVGPGRDAPTERVEGRVPRPTRTKP
jgi:hypothetical protein